MYIPRLEAWYDGNIMYIEFFAEHGEECEMGWRARRCADQIRDYFSESHENLRVTIIPPYLQLPQGCHSRLGIFLAKGQDMVELKKLEGQLLSSIREFWAQPLQNSS